MEMFDLIGQLEELCDDQRERVAELFNRIRNLEVKMSGEIGFLIGTLTGLRCRVDEDTRLVIDKALEKTEAAVKIQL
jgi:hypothetical protein